MLSKRLIGASLAALLAGSGAAMAADLSYPSSPPPAAAYTPAPAWSWTGAYAGLTGGYGWARGPASNSGLLGGIYGGFNYETPSHWVLGAEGDFTFTGKSGGGVSNPWDTTFRGRVGYAFDRFMIYGTGGLAVGQVNAGTNTTKVGWTAGAGLESALTDTVTGRVEYRHTDLGTVAGSTYTSNDLMVGIGVKF